MNEMIKAERNKICSRKQTRMLFLAGVVLIVAYFFFFQFNYQNVFYDYDLEKMALASGFTAIEQRKEVAEIFEGKLSQNTLLTTFRLELLDGYCGGTIKTYTDENRNLYISVLRTVIKEELSDGETEIMNYGFNHEKKDYIAVYYGTPNNCELIWKKGDLLPTAPKDIFE